MPSYFIFSIVGVLAVFAADHIFKTHLLKMKRFWIFQAIVFVFTLIFDNYAVANGIYSHNTNMITGIRLPFAPIEDFIFGFSLLYLNLMVYEKLTSSPLGYQ